MAGTIRKFTDEEIELIGRVVARERTDRKNISREITEQGELNQIIQSPEVYVARVPQPGIPALTVVNPGEDKVFSRVCDIYRLKYNISDQQMVLHDMGLRHQVYNVSQDVIDSLYAIIRRDKYGNWIAERPVDLTGTGSGTGSGTGQPLNQFLCCAEICDTTGGQSIGNAEDNILFDSISPVFSDDAVFLLNPFLGELTINVEGGGDFAISYQVGFDKGPEQGFKTTLEHDNGTETWNTVVCPETNFITNATWDTHATSPVILISLFEGEKIRVHVEAQTHQSPSDVTTQANASFLSICKVCCTCSPAITKADTGTGTDTGTPES